VVIGLNATIGFFTEWKAEQALTVLQKQTGTRSVDRVLPGAARAG
jgi:hypothetical protein